MGYKRYIEGLPDPSPISTKSLPMDEFICMQSGLCGHKWVAEEAAMFEGAQEQKQSSSNHMLLTILVVLAAARGGRLYTMSKSTPPPAPTRTTRIVRDRKSTRLNSHHSPISYALLFLKKKTKK